MKKLLLSIFAVLAVGAGAQAADRVYPTITKETVGATDKSTAFCGDWSQDFLLKPGEKIHFGFTNYGGASQWNNFCVSFNDVVLNREVLFLRVDKYGWGEYYTSLAYTTDFTDWTTFATAMNDGANVKIDIEYTNGKLNMVYVAAGESAIYTGTYDFEGAINNNMNIKLTVDNSYFTYNKEGEQYDVYTESLGTSESTSTELTSTKWCGFEGTYTTTAFDQAASGEAVTLTEGTALKTKYTTNAVGTDIYAAGPTVVVVDDTKKKYYIRTDDFAWDSSDFQTNTNLTLKFGKYNTIGAAFTLDNIVGSTVTLTLSYVDGKLYLLREYYKEGVISGTQYMTGIPVSGDVQFSLVGDNGTGITYCEPTEGEKTAIESIVVEDSDAPSFNILGQRVGANAKGIIIRNGKKIVVM